MIHLIVVENPFDRRSRKDYYLEYEQGKSVSEYKSYPQEMVYALDGQPVNKDVIPVDGQEMIVMPLVQGKALGLILSVGLAVFSGGIATGAYAFTAGWSVGVRAIVAMAISCIGGVLVNKLTPMPKVDMSNTEQSNTYGWGGMKSLSGQGYVLPVVYGTMKTAGIMLQQHVVSDGEKQYLNVLYALAEGEIDSIENIRLNENPFSYFTDVVVEKRFGTNTQPIIENFNDSYADTPLSFELNPGNDWSMYQLDGNTAQAIELTISFPQGLYYSNDSGGLSKTWVRIEAQIRKVGSADWIDLPILNDDGEDTKKGFLVGRMRRKHNGTWEAMQSDNTAIYGGVLRGKTNTPFYKVYGFYDLKPAQYEVRVRCAAKDGTTVRYVNKVQWSGVTQVIYDDFTYPGKALLGLKALATDQLSGNNPSMTCHVSRNWIWAWNPTAHEWQKKPANNPAWAAYDILLHCRQIENIHTNTMEFVIDGDIAKEQMDYYAFEAWANACTEAGAEFNYLFDTAMRKWDAINYPCRVGRGAVLPVGTKLTCIYDYASEPVQLFNVSNIKKDSFKEEFLGLENRANAIEISFLNKDKNYERDVLTVYSDGFDSTTKVQQPTQIELMGCTSAEQAYRYGRYKLRSNQYEIRTVTFDAFVDAIACNIGDVIIVQSDVTNWGSGGRVVSVTGNTIKVDTAIDEDSSEVMVRDQSTDKIYKAIITARQDEFTITVDSATGFSPDAIYTAGKTGREAKLFRVLTIEKSQNEQTRTIVAVEYYPELYSADLSAVPEIIPYDTSVPAPYNLLANVKLYPDSLCKIFCTWNNPKQAYRIYLEVQEGNSKWDQYGVFTRNESAYSFDADPTKIYKIRVYAENEIGVKSLYAKATVNISSLVRPAMEAEDIQAYTRYRQLKDGTSMYDLVVTWKPDSLMAQIYYKTNHQQAFEINVVEGMKADDLGFSGAWIYAGQGKGQISIPRAVPGDTYRIAICTQNELGVYTLPDEAQRIEKTVQIKTTTPNTPDGFSISFDKEATCRWNAVTNTDIQFYEVRNNQNAGQEGTGLLARTSGLSATVPLSVRTGTLYLYASGTDGKYSAPAILTYNKPAPPKPNPPQLLAILGGFSVKTDAIPAGCAGVALYIDGYSLTKVRSVNNTYTHTCEAGIYDVTAAFFDLFGEGEQSGASRVTVKEKVSSEMLEEEAVSLDKVDTVLKTAVANANAAIPRLDGLDTDISRIDQTTASITQTVQGHTSDISQIRQTATSIQSTVQSNKTAQDAVNSGFTGDISQLRQTANTIQSTVQSNKTAQDSVNSGFSSQITQNSSSVTSIVTNLGSLAKAKQYYTAFTQLDNAINLRVAKGDVINQINISPTTTKIDGKYLHVTGQTVFDSNVIVSRMLQAGAVTTDKLAARAVTTDKLSIGSASGARMTLTPNLLRVYDSSGRLRIKMGVW